MLNLEQWINHNRKNEVSYDDKTLKDLGIIKSIYYLHKDYFLKNAERCKINKDIVHKGINLKLQKIMKEKYK
jgi:hypothetical protein